VRFRTLVLIALASVAAAGSLSPASSAARPVYAAYFGGWDVYSRGFFPKDIPARRLTHVFYAFAVPGSDGTCRSSDSWADYGRPFTAAESVDGVGDGRAQALRGNFNQLRELKRRHRGLKVLLTIGGWGGSRYFSDVAATPEARRKFAASCVDRFLRGNLEGLPRGAAAGVFNGLDIDWEYPGGGDPGNIRRPTDRANATLLFRTLRRHLDRESARAGRRYRLTAALPVGTSRFELARVADTLDWANLMTYDLHGPWESTTHFNAPFGGEPGSVLSVRGAVSAYLASGVPRRKIVVGVPFYARQFVRVRRTALGLHQPFDNRGLVSGASEWTRKPTPTYRELVDVARIVTDSRRDPRARRGYTRRWSSTAHVPWLYAPKAEHPFGEVSAFISYDDPQSVARKARYVRRQGLRGLMAWEVSQDSERHSLLRALSPKRVR
jgi:chitinase